jgi:hypothetical protein
MNDVLDSWSSPWRAFHKSVAAAAPHAERRQEQEQTPGAGSWLSQARAAADTTRMRPDQTTDH